MSVDNLSEFNDIKEKLDSILRQIGELVFISAFQEAEQKLVEVIQLYEHLGQLADPNSSGHHTLLENRASRIQTWHDQIQSGLMRNNVRMPRYSCTLNEDYHHMVWETLPEVGDRTQMGKTPKQISTETGLVPTFIIDYTYV